MRRKLKDKSVRKIYKRSGSYALTIPMEIIKEMGIKENQKVVVKRERNRIIIKDWKK
ncbi:MAG: AbrB/MazE/SpoVT family DNA-binding domain-containing protein [Candidatus Moranbacteria bacterium]|jgi:antitoxin component of MazEF toxin-antitoxin module|nr:AbrB/MazE/SpoVT family DNA-binding domain-containing protein [Candidatus Moranbacteria bacterium]MDD5651934.1 AbrB/MazE/SpoVT family DNA-binding domain-containing protein [Candidatus Moranbacteria bacterium]MDX9855373.1 AbrB/MazE/SpoVT family DNA-binding domain-containing protein [Candidatus Moranbacteria bacterium]